MRSQPIPPDEFREDFRACAERHILLTVRVLETLSKAIQYQDVTRDRWAAGIIRATPEGEDPIQAVRDELAEILRLRNGYARWEERLETRGLAKERAFLGSRDREAEVARIRAEREDEAAEWAAEEAYLG